MMQAHHDRCGHCRREAKVKVKANSAKVWEFMVDFEIGITSAACRLPSSSA